MTNGEKRLGSGAIGFAPLVLRKVEGLSNSKTQKNLWQMKSPVKSKGISGAQLGWGRGRGEASPALF